MTGVQTCALPIFCYQTLAAEANPDVHIGEAWYTVLYKVKVPARAKHPNKPPALQPGKGGQVELKRPEVRIEVAVVAAGLLDQGINGAPVPEGDVPPGLLGWHSKGDPAQQGKHGSAVFRGHGSPSLSVAPRANRDAPHTLRYPVTCASQFLLRRRFAEEVVLGGGGRSRFAGAVSQVKGVLRGMGGVRCDVSGTDGLFV